MGHGNTIQRAEIAEKLCTLRKIVPKFIHILTDTF